MTLIDRHLQRLAGGTEPLGVLDLFSGCGGMTLGFKAAGFRSVGGVEMDAWAARSHALNFHPDSPHRAAHEQARDITQADPLALMRAFGEPEDAVDVLVGGPPCVTFTRVGRAKLRDLRNDPLAYRNDPRSLLFESYLRFVEALQPLALLMENVPDILNQNGQNVGQEIADGLRDLGYVSRYTLLNAAHFGVPQSRDRFFLIAFHERLGIVPSFPAPTHHWELTQGYHGSRNVALKHIAADAQLSLVGTHDFVTPPAPRRPTTPAVTVAEALDDLPDLSPGARGRRDMTTSVGYRPRFSPSDYALAMRTFEGYSSAADVTAHQTRSLSDRDPPIFARMAPGDEYPAARAIAEALFEAEVAERGGRAAIDAENLEALRARTVPPYDPGKFPNKWRKLDPAQPARTLMAHLGKDTYSHIHHDARQARVISVREAARLQSFPDGFRFAGTMNPAFRQIGNAVPPLLARALAGEMSHSLSEAVPGLKSEALEAQAPEALRVNRPDRSRPRSVAKAARSTGAADLLVLEPQ